MSWLKRTLADRPYDYEALLTAALQRYSVTETEFKDILVDLKKRGLVDFVGLAPSQWKPKKGICIKAAA